MKLKIKIIEENENQLFNRKEVNLIIESISAPKRSEISKFLSDKFSIPEENIQIESIKGKFGTNNFNIRAYIYYSKKDKDEIELKKKETNTPTQTLQKF